MDEAFPAWQAQQPACWPTEVHWGTVSKNQRKAERHKSERDKKSRNRYQLLLREQGVLEAEGGAEENATVPQEKENS